MHSFIVHLSTVKQHKTDNSALNIDSPRRIPVNVINNVNLISVKIPVSEGGNRLGLIYLRYCEGNISVLAEEPLDSFNLASAQ